MEGKITVKSGPCRLEGYWRPGTANKGVVITHPHPLYGGTMRNPVVETVQSAYAQHGYTTLRFNFRGVGSSQGDFDNGVGEQDDVRAAIAYLKHRDVEAVGLAGYSFGAWVNAGVAADKHTAIMSMTMVSPPVGFIEFENVKAMSCLNLIVTGSRDDIAPANRIRELLPNWNPKAQFEVIDGCDHFYVGYLDKLRSILTSFLKTQKPLANEKRQV
ncbi:MAG: CocE/NonD family hydrolase [Desulfobacterales bacterium]|jgi:alpha/beta superfamily hydrolase